MLPLWSTIQSYIKKFWDKFQAKANEVLKKQYKLILIVSCAFLVLFISLMVIMLLINHSPNFQVNSSRKLINAFKPVSIPAEELFLPDKPDFLPKILLEREPRARWTPEDAHPFWYDPLQDDSEQWRDTIEMVIDELLEGVP